MSKIRKETIYKLADTYSVSILGIENCVKQTAILHDKTIDEIYEVLIDSIKPSLKSDNLYNMALYMDNETLAYFCDSNKYVKQKICESPIFWLERPIRDDPLNFIINAHEDTLPSWEWFKEYKRVLYVYNRSVKFVESIVNSMMSLGRGNLFFTSEKIANRDAVLLNRYVIKSLKPHHEDNVIKIAFSKETDLKLWITLNNGTVTLNTTNYIKRSKNVITLLFTYLFYHNIPIKPFSKHSNYRNVLKHVLNRKKCLEELWPKCAF